MSDVKLLNLDELATVKRAVQIGGVEYPVAEQTIGQMIQRLALSKKEDSDSMNPEVFLKNMRQTAQDILPTAPKKVIDGLSLKMITKLVEFLNDQELDKAADSMKEVSEQSGEKTEVAPVETGKKS